MSLLVSVHVAKAGGSALYRVLRQRYGDRLLADYADNPADPVSQRILDPARYAARNDVIPDAIDCVHGHFHPGKYKLRRDTILSTILRHPVDNVISIYFFWKTLGHGNDALHDYVIRQRLSLVETARLPLIRRLFSETYFGGFDMARFDLIGRHDRRAEALERLARLTGGPLDAGIAENVTPVSAERQAVMADPALLRKLEDILADDVRFYERLAR